MIDINKFLGTNFNEVETEIIEYLIKNKNGYSAQIARALHKSSPYVNDKLNSLFEGKTITKAKSGIKTIYMLNGAFMRALQTAIDEIEKIKKDNGLDIDGDTRT